jgi:serine/threonine protein kinase
LDRELNREVAIKEIKTEYARDSEARQRFNLEAEITAKLEHPGVVPVYGLGHRVDGQPFYAMRFIAGDSLKDACAKYYAGKKKRSSSENILLFRDLLARFIDVCNTIAYAHSRGVLHRDLKPGNIMLGKYGETLVVDWGLAKSVLGRNNDTEYAQQSSQTSTTGSTTATLTGSVLGTPQFMSPEQASGRLGELGAASDIYSLGATLYYLLVNNAPYAGQPANQILENVGKGLFPKPREIDPSISRALEAICLKAMALHPQDRYSSPEELAKDIERYLAEEPTEAYKESFIGKILRIARKICLPFAAGYLFFNSFAYCLFCVIATPFYLYENPFLRTTYDIVLMVVFSIAYMGVFGAIGVQLGYFVLKGNVKSLWLAEILYLIVTCATISVIPRQISLGDTDDIAAQFLLLATSSVGLALVTFAILNRDRSIKI